MPELTQGQLNRWDDYTAAASRRSNRWATTDRGWLFAGDVCLGHYLDYGPDHYRSPHEYCRDGSCNCRESQPGNIHCVAMSGNPDNNGPRLSRYVETIEDAHRWIEEQAQCRLAAA